MGRSRQRQGNFVFVRGTFLGAERTSARPRKLLVSRSVNHAGSSTEIGQSECLIHATTGYRPENQGTSCRFWQGTMRCWSISGIRFHVEINRVPCYVAVRPGYTLLCRFPLSYFFYFLCRERGRHGATSDSGGTLFVAASALSRFLVVSFFPRPFFLFSLHKKSEPLHYYTPPCTPQRAANLFPTTMDRTLGKLA